MRSIVACAVFLAGVTSVVAGPAPDWAVAVFPSGAEFSLEIADSGPERQVGYMFRDEVPPLEGMLFVFDAPERHGIWMRNCRVSLDIIWLDKSFRVLEIFAAAQPCPADGPCPQELSNGVKPDLCHRKDP